MKKTSLFRLGALALLSVGLFACGSGDESTSAEPNGSHATRTKAVGTLAEQAARAQWSALTQTSIVPISATNLPDGRLLMWSSESRFSFSFGADGGRTFSVLYDPATGQLTERLVTETGHDMFCPGTTNLPDGRLLVNGGLSSGKTSIFDPANDSWSTAAAMNIPRAYNANTLLADGSVLTLGGSWDGGVGNKHGERWSAATGWQRLTGVPIDSMLSFDPTSNFGQDSHLWLLPTGNGQVLHAGPGRQMNWIDTRGAGRVRPAGPRGDDAFSISGNTVMFDTGKILKVGGGPGYSGVQANANSYLIDASNGIANVRRIASMAYPRAFQNAVVLPNGQVIIIGGQTFPVNFSDDNSVLLPELFDPASESFTQLPAIAVGRNYHSIALLLPDGRIWSGGGGLCGDGCAANHANFQIMSPPYLFDANGQLATRPVITNAPRTAAYGTTVTVSADSAIDSFALVRLSSTTHTVNNDQRRLSLNFRATGGNNYALEIPSNPGWALPGEYMLFAMNGDGTPSVSRPLRIAANNALWLTPPDELFGTVGAPLELTLQASANGGGTLSYGATGLPEGLLINPGNGRISGTPTRAGVFAVSLMASSGDQTVSWQTTWSIGELGNVRHVRFEALSEINGNPWASMAEFELLDEQGRVLPRNGWGVSASSAETQAENGAAANAIDGDPATYWHSQFQGFAPTHPHQLNINLGGTQRIGGFRYTPRVAGANGTVANYRLYFSNDGVNWGAPVAVGDLRTLGGNAEPKTIYLGNLATGKPATQSSTAAGGTYAASRAVDGNTNGILANGSTSQTGNENNAWWEVDLGSNNTLHAVRLWNRSDCCGETLSNLYVLVSQTPMIGRSLPALLADPAVRNVPIIGPVGLLSTLGNAGSGRYLRVQLAGNGPLPLAEVEVFGNPSVNRAPVIAPTNPPVTRSGANTSLQLSATDADGDTLVWAASGLPTGLVLDGARGLITGQPLAQGNFTVQLSVSDSRGGNDTSNFNWNVLAQELTVAPVAAPVVTSGANTGYTVNATGAGLQYRWNFGDGTAETAYSNNATINHQYGQSGIYTVTLSVRDTSGAVTTRNFMQAVVGSTSTGRASASGNLALDERNGASRIWVVNPDNDSVSVFNTLNNTRLAEVAVGRGPRALAVAPNGRIWVTNRDDASLSLIDPTSLAVVQTILLPNGSGPYGVVVAPDGGALVALEASGRLLKVTASGNFSADVSAVGARHLALSADGSRLLVSRYVSAAQPGEGSANVRTSLNGNATGGEITEFDPITLAQLRRFVLRHSDRIDSTLSARGVPNYLGAAAISPDGRAAWIPSKQDNVQRGLLRDGQNLDFQTTVRAISSRLDLNSGTEDYAGRVDHDNAGVASAATYHPNGAYVFVTLESSRQVAVMDAQGRRELFRFDTGRAPQGLKVSADGRRLYVHNFMDRNVAVFDLAPLVDYGNLQVNLVTQLASVSADRLATNVLVGKQLFYDARDERLARDHYLSCAACHNDGGHDGRTWDLTGFGEGLRNTPSLKGRGASGHGSLHWSANFDEVQDFEGQIRSLAAGTGLMSDAQFFAGSRRNPLGDRKTGVSSDLDALAAYVNSLVSMSPSPYRNANRSLTNAAQAGRDLFQSLNCASCHGGAQYAGAAQAHELRNIGTLKASSGQRLGGPLTGIDVPTLRDVWDTAPYLHDGSATTIDDAIRAHNGFELQAADIASLSAFVREIGSEEATPINTVAPAGTACAAQGGICSLPAGASASVSYLATGGFIRRAGVSGNLACNNATFGDPMVGAVKSCSYVITSGSVANGGGGSGGGGAGGGSGSGSSPGSGSSSHQGSASGAAQFSVVGSNNELSLASGAATEVDLNLSFVSATGLPVHFSCVGLPAYVRCLFDPAVVTPSATRVASTKVTISTQSVGTVALLGTGAAGTGLAMALVGMGGASRRRRRAYSIVLFGVMIASTSALTGCGGGGGGGGSGSGSGSGAASGSTPAGTYPITIVATDGQTTQSLPYVLTVR